LSGAVGDILRCDTCRRVKKVAMTVVHWARHGENVANLSGTFSYRVFDGDLTDRGIAQARRLAERLHAATDCYGLLVCSPLRRARQTAQIVSGQLGLPVAAELDDLREVNVGELDGRADDSAWRVYEPTLAGWRSGRLSQRFPGGESGDELAARTRRALRGIAAQAGGADAVVIAHGASIRAAVPALTGQPDPGRDLATSDVARFAVTCGQGSAVRIALTAWA
jgi:broad specificity phosphatase PhoE